MKRRKFSREFKIEAANWLGAWGVGGAGRTRPGCS